LLFKSVIQHSPVAHFKLVKN